MLEAKQSLHSVQVILSIGVLINCAVLANSLVSFAVLAVSYVHGELAGRMQQPKHPWFPEQ